MLGRERELLLEAFDSNWIAPLGPHLNAFESEFSAKVGVPYAAGLASGTAALHLALRILGVGPGDQVVTSSFTFVATANAILQVGAEPIFIDSDWSSWNMDPNLLRDELSECRQRGKMPAAVLTVDIVGQCCDYAAITEICREFDVPLIEDAAESLGASFQGRPAGSFGEIACFSFNGNKIITTSGGGMLVSHQESHVRRARHLATQARDPAPHYEHTEAGYNYRLSNLLAAVGRGQLEHLETHVHNRRRIFQQYVEQLADCPGISFMPEIPGGVSTRWLTLILVDPKQFGADREQIRMALEAQDIEARPAWKPMHQQPLFRGRPMRGRAVSDKIFEQGLCLPSGTALSDAELQRVVQAVRGSRG